ncbi:MAG TPA: PilN domain-containing protein [Thermoanaerobaculia bacterium]|nr:PilN domain-containing protein [Thermoanaerobaculia bacterium]
MIKINLVREGRAVRGTGAAPALVTTSIPGVAAPGANVNNIIVGVLVLIGIVAAVGYWYWYKRELSERQAIVEQKTQEAQKLEAIIREVEEYQRRKDSLQQRIDLINQLKQNQKGPVRIMDQISRDLPDLVWLDAMNITAGRISLNGRGLNPNAIALFIENIKRDPFFEEPAVGTVAQVSAAPLVYAFDMTFAFTYAPKTPEPPPAAGAAPGGTAPAAQ